MTEPTSGQTDAFANIGIALVHVQGTERVIRTSLDFLPGAASLTIENILSRQSLEERQTLPRFLTELRKRATLDHRFDNILFSFLSMRNMLVHDFDGIPGMDLNTAGGLGNCRVFTNELVRLSEVVLKIFTTIITRWNDELLLANIPHDPVVDDAVTKYGSPVVPLSLVQAAAGE